MSQLQFTEEELKAFRAEYAKGASDTQFNLFISECIARNLRPGSHLVFQLRNSKEWDPVVGASVFVKKPYWITTIGALRLIALRTGQYGGSTPPQYIYLDDSGDPTIISEIPLPNKQNKQLPREPWAVRVSVKRKDFDEPITSVVRFDSVAATQKRGEEIVLTDMWTKRGDAQNAKCSEADALRKAFPEELGSLYLSEEIKNETPEEEKIAAVTPASVVSMPVSAPAVDQTPATPTDAPRPNESPKPDPVAIEAVKAAVPDLKPASEIPAPKKRGPKPKENPVSQANPVNGHGITDEDIASAGTPPPEVNQEELKKEVEEFTAGIDPTPTKEEQAGFTARVRALTSAGAASVDLKNFILNGKTDVKQLTVRDWRTALETLESAQKEGKLKETIAEKLKEVKNDTF
jgi:hypothetical protein